MIEMIFLEQAVEKNPFAIKILNYFSKIPVKKIDKLENIFEAVKRPYLNKREGLQLFIGEKKGQLIKETPEAYGHLEGKHFYFIHAYNCIYECEYCYLQGYFNSPDLVLFVNHNDIIGEMEKLVELNPKDKFVFHAGEFSDSLALSHITKEWELYWDFFSKYQDRAFLELRTKSNNIKAIENLPSFSNVTIGFSISSQKSISLFDRKTPSLKARLQAIEILNSKGFKIGFHFDPIILSPDFLTEYQQLIQAILEIVKAKKIAYFSLGVVRFTKKVYREVINNYPKSEFMKQNMVKNDGMIRYPYDVRMFTLNQIKKKLLQKGISEKQIYFCMEKSH